MSLQPSDFPIKAPVPAGTRRVAEAAFPCGNDYLRLRDELGPLFRDADFADLYSHRGQPAYSPARLALVTAMQYMENLSDRQAAEAVRARIDWKYALALPLSDAGFDSSVLCEFRKRLLRGSAEERLLDGIIERLNDAGLVKKRGRQRTDSTRVLASVRELSRLELVGETMRAALNELSEKAPAFVRRMVGPGWLQRYGRRVEETRLPKGKKARAMHASHIGRDGFQILDALTGEPEELAELSEFASVRTLRRVWNQQYEQPEERGAFPTLQERRGRSRSSEGSSRAESPYDPEARYRKQWTGYMVHLSETCDDGQPRLVTHALTTPADVHEAECAAGIHEALAQKGLAPSVHLTDSAYVGAGHLAEAEDEHGIQMVGPTRKDPSWQARINAREGMAIAHSRAWLSPTAGHGYRPQQGPVRNRLDNSTGHLSGRETLRFLERAHQRVARGLHCGTLLDGRLPRLPGAHALHERSAAKPDTASAAGAPRAGKNAGTDADLPGQEALREASWRGRHHVAGGAPMRNAAHSLPGACENALGAPRRRRGTEPLARGGVAERAGAGEDPSLALHAADEGSGGSDNLTEPSFSLRELVGPKSLAHV